MLAALFLNDHLEPLTATPNLHLFQVASKDCEHVFKGKKLMQCLPNPNDVKMALEIYKLSREIEILELQIRKETQTTLEW